MADGRPARRSIVIATAGWLALTAAACGQPTTLEGGARTAPSPPAPPPAATSATEAQALARALAPRMGAPAEGWKAVPDARGNLVIKTGGRLQNVTVVGRGSDGQVVSGCVSTPEQVTSLLGSAGGH